MSEGKNDDRYFYPVIKCTVCSALTKEWKWQKNDSDEAIYGVCISCPPTTIDGVPQAGMAENHEQKSTVLIKFSLSYCGVKESDVFDCEGMSDEEIEKELVQWVLERVDHWSEKTDAN